MKNSLLIKIILFCLCLQQFNSLAQTQQAPEWQWATAIPSLSFEDGVFPRAITVNDQELVTVGGTFAAAMVLGPDTIINYQPTPLPYNLFYSFQATYGNQGAYQYGMHSTSEGSIWALAHDAQGYTYSLGTFTDSAGATFLHLFKYDPINGFSGGLQIPFNSPTADGLSLAVTPMGEVYITSLFIDTLTIGNTTLVSAGYQDAYVAKFNTILTVEWVKQISGPQNEVGVSLALAPDGGCFLAGTHGNNAQIGNQPLTNQGGHDVFLARFSPQGTLVWAQTAGGNGVDKPISLAVAPNGNLFLTGYFQNQAQFGSITLTSLGADDLFLASWSAQGLPLWAKAGGTTSYDYPVQVATDSASNGYLLFGAANTGFVYNGAPLTGAQAQADYLMKLNPIGEPLWVKSLGNATWPEVVRGGALAVAPEGESYVTGVYRGGAVFGNTPLDSTHMLSFSGFVAKLNATVVGLEPQIAKQKLIMHPNPASGSFTVLLPEMSQEPVQVQLHSLTGQLVLDQLFSGSQAQVLVALPALPAGLYVVSVAGQHFLQTGKLILD